MNSSNINPMKRIYPLLLLCLVLFGCQGYEINDIDELAIGGYGKILLSSETPFASDYADKYSYYNYYVIDVGSKGGEYTVLASYPEDEGVPLDDTFFIAWSEEIPEEMVNVSRTKVNAYQSSYVVSVKPNTLGKSYKCYIMMFDESRKDKSGKTVTSRATLILRQQ